MEAEGPEPSERDKAILNAIWKHTDAKTTQGPVELILKALHEGGIDDATVAEVEEIRALLKQVRAAETKQNVDRFKAYVDLMFGPEKDPRD